MSRLHRCFKWVGISFVISDLACFLLLDKGFDGGGGVLQYKNPVISSYAMSEVAPS